MGEWSDWCEMHKGPPKPCPQCDAKQSRIEALERQLAEAVQNEREACAKVAEEYPSNEWHAIAIVRGIAAAIRERQQP